MTDLKIFSTRIDPQLKKALKHLSVEMERSLTDLAEEAFRDLLKKYEQQIQN